MGIYYPWYTKRITDYLAQKTSLDNDFFQFKGRPAKLLQYFILALIIPLIIWAIIFSILVVHLSKNKYSIENFSLIILTAVVYLFLFILIAPFLYLAYKWNINFEWKGKKILWNTNFWPSVGFIAGQTLLTIITLGIYWPVLLIKSYRYFISKTILVENEVEIGRFAFEGTCKEGFALIWGQTLLSIITIGIYTPWAYANVMRWVFEKSSLETEQLLLEE